MAAVDEGMRGKMDDLEFLQCVAANRFSPRGKTQESHPLLRRNQACNEPGFAPRIQKPGIGSMALPQWLPARGRIRAPDRISARLHPAILSIKDRIGEHGDI